jgi:pimeloyl-ACP methyl ester carboxylesterase
VGHSLGGSEALLFAQRNPAMTRGLFLIDPAAYREGAMGGRWFWNMPLLPEAILSLLPPQTVVWIALTRNFHDNDAIPDQIKAAYLREARREGALNALIEQERQIVPRAPAEWEAGHRAIKAPTLILWGEDDRMVPPAQGRRLTNDIAGAGLVMLPATGHSAHLEAPAR